MASDGDWTATADAGAALGKGRVALFAAAAM